MNKKKVTYQELMMAVSDSSPRPTPQQNAESSKWVVAAGVAGLIGVLALMNYMGKKS